MGLRIHNFIERCVSLLEMSIKVGEWVVGKREKYETKASSRLKG